MQLEWNYLYMKCIRHKSIISSSLFVYKTKLINFWVYASVHQRYITFRAPDFCSCCLLDYLMAFVLFNVRGLTVPTMVASLVVDIGQKHVSTVCPNLSDSSIQNAKSWTFCSMEQGIIICVIRPQFVDYQLLISCPHGFSAMQFITNIFIFAY